MADERSDTLAGIRSLKIDEIGSLASVLEVRSVGPCPFVQEQMFHPLA